MSVIAGFFVLCMIGYAAFVCRAAWYFSRATCQTDEAVLPTVSIVIPARNEALSIKTCLEAVLRQDYPQHLLQVIVIDDHSTDDTGAIAASLIPEYSVLEVLNLRTDATNSYKKAAISAGIERARGEIILQTDADCYMKSGWVRAMVAHFEEEVALVSGPLKIDTDNSLFSRFQSLESMGLVAIGAGSLLAGRPNMCNGANLAYRKSAFEAVGGFRGIDAVASGDDELLLQKLHAQPGYRLQFAKCRDAIVHTAAMKSWSGFKSQRLRWVSKARFYPNRWVNLAQAVSYLAFVGVCVVGGLNLWDATYWLPWLMIVALKLLADSWILYQAAKFFHNLQLLWLLLPLQPLYLVYVLWIGIAGNLVSTYSWKGRTVR